MELIKGCLGKDGVERYFKIIRETIDTNGFCNGYGVSFDYDIRKEKTVLIIQKFSRRIPVQILLYKKLYCHGGPVIKEYTFEEEFEKHKHEFVYN